MNGSGSGDIDLNPDMWPPRAQAEFKRKVEIYAQKLKIVSEYFATVRDPTASVTEKIVDESATSLGNQRGYELISAVAGALLAFSISGFWALIVVDDASIWLWVVTAISAGAAFFLLAVQKDKLLAQFRDMLTRAKAAQIALASGGDPLVISTGTSRLEPGPSATPGHAPTVDAGEDAPSGPTS